MAADDPAETDSLIIIDVGVESCAPPAEVGITNCISVSVSPWAARPSKSIAKVADALIC